MSYSRLNQQWLEDRPIADIAVEVEGLIATALRLDPRLSDVYAVRAALRSDQNKFKEAQDDLNIAISLNPNDSVALAELGRLSLRKGQPRDALVSFNRAVALDPLDFGLTVQLCTALQDMGRYDEARAACERAHQLQPDNAGAVNQLTWLAWSRGSMGDALRWNTESLKLAPDTFDYYWTRAELYWTLGLAKRARKTLEEGRAATKDEETAGVAMGSVAYLEGGPEALRSQLNSARLDESAAFRDPRGGCSAAFAAGRTEGGGRSHQPRSRSPRSRSRTHRTRPGRPDRASPASWCWRLRRSRWANTLSRLRGWPASSAC